MVSGYTVHYYAEGSNIRQFTEDLPPHQDNYDIQHLHENTNYEVCVWVINNVTEDVSSCMRATTSVDSLFIALGSTFGAFLTLGIVAFFVFLAKWQHSRKLKKQLRMMGVGDRKYSSIKKSGSRDLEMSDMSIQANDGTVSNAPGSSKASPSDGRESGESGEEFADGEEPELNGAEFGSEPSSPEEYERQQKEGLLHQNLRPAQPRQLADLHQKSLDSQTSGETPPMVTPPEGTAPYPTVNSLNSAPRPAYGGARPKEYHLSTDAQQQKLIELPNPNFVDENTNVKW